MAYLGKQTLAHGASNFPTAQRSIDFRAKIPNRPPARSAPKVDAAKNPPSGKPANSKSQEKAKP